MGVLFSAETMGFYPLGIPEGSEKKYYIELSDEEYDRLKGQALMMGDDGRPTLYVAPAPTADELKTDAYSQRDNLLRVAALRIAPLQDAVDLDEANDAEASLLKSWKKYRVELNRIQDQSGFPTKVKWPEAPSAD